MEYSFGTYTRETEIVRCSSISFASFRASSTGWTCVRKARPNIPSKRPSIFCSMPRRTLIRRGVGTPSSTSLMLGPRREPNADGRAARGPRPDRPGGQDEREGSGRGGDEHAGGERGGAQEGAVP